MWAVWISDIKIYMLETHVYMFETFWYNGKGFWSLKGWYISIQNQKYKPY